jgi:cytochrome c biogenesis protein CcmG, thiol:disulfide interchange protein DsbE
MSTPTGQNTDSARLPGTGWLRHTLPLAAFALLLLLLYLGLGRDPKLLPSPLVGKPAPAIDLPALHDPGLRITTQTLRGEPTVVNVWASWCVACRQEHEVLLDLAASQRVRIIGLDYKDAPEDAQGWLDRLGNPYRLVAVDADGRAGIDWGVYGVPETFFLDAEGVVRHKHVGPLDPRTLDDALALIGVGAGAAPLPAGAGER